MSRKGMFAARAEETAERFKRLRLAELPDPLRRDGTRHYYLSVYPSIAELRPCSPADYPAYPEKIRNVYLHVPFCSGACSFCSYYFKVVKGAAPELESYPELVLRELELHARHAELEIGYLYVGGGTPSLLGAEAVRRFLTALHRRGWIADGFTATLEAHPELFENEGRAADLLGALRDGGVHRLSVGYQVADEGILQDTRRRHAEHCLEDVFRHVRDAGFLLNIDLMYGLPGQSLEAWHDSLVEVAERGPDSISTYFTFIDPGTLLHHQVAQGDVEKPDYETVHKQRLLANSVLTDAGYRELPNDFWWKATGDERPEEFTATLPSDSHTLPVGPGAYGFFSPVQFANVFSLADYRRALEAGERPIWRHYPLDASQLLRRDVMFTLKNAPYLSPDLFQRRYGQSIERLFAPQLDELLSYGLLRRDGDVFRVTEKGSLCVEEMACLFRDPAIRAAPEPGAKLRRFNFSPTYGADAMP